MEQVGDVVMASNSHNQILMIRGKRTKRPRPSFPLSLTMACSSSSSVGEVIGRGFPDGATISPTTSSTGITDIPDSCCLLSEEEEDMANCLILLAQGSATFQKPNTAGLYVYRCMTCDKSFSSFQALGGHRASHKKPKPENTTTEGRKATWHFAGDKSEKDEEDRYLSFSSNTANTTLSLKMMTNNNRVSYSNNKVHECAICGAEFSSGQALGGHMRRHRSFTSTSSTNLKMTSATAGLGNNNIKTSITEEVQKKSNPRNSLGVDLNLPAPEESHPRESSPKKLRLLIPNNNDQSSTLCTRPPALVDCTY